MTDEMTSNSRTQPVNDVDDNDRRTKQSGRRLWPTVGRTDQLKPAEWRTVTQWPASNDEQTGQWWQCGPMPGRQTKPVSDYWPDRQLLKANDPAQLTGSDGQTQMTQTNPVDDNDWRQPNWANGRTIEDYYCIDPIRLTDQWRRQAQLTQLTDSGPDGPRRRRPAQRKWPQTQPNEDSVNDPIEQWQPDSSVTQAQLANWWKLKAQTQPQPQPVDDPDPFIEDSDPMKARQPTKKDQPIINPDNDHGYWWKAIEEMTQLNKLLLTQANWWRTDRTKRKLDGLTDPAQLLLSRRRTDGRWRTVVLKTIDPVKLTDYCYWQAMTIDPIIEPSDDPDEEWPSIDPDPDGQPRQLLNDPAQCWTQTDIDGRERQASWTQYWLWQWWAQTDKLVIIEIEQLLVYYWLLVIVNDQMTKWPRRTISEWEIVTEKAQWPDSEPNLVNDEGQPKEKWRTADEPRLLNWRWTARQTDERLTDGQLIDIIVSPVDPMTRRRMTDPVGRTDPVTEQTLWWPRRWPSWTRTQLLLIEPNDNWPNYWSCSDWRLAPARLTQLMTQLTWPRRTDPVDGPSIGPVLKTRTMTQPVLTQLVKLNPSWHWTVTLLANYWWTVSRRLIGWTIVDWTVGPVDPVLIDQPIIDPLFIGIVIVDWWRTDEEIVIGYCYYCYYWYCGHWWLTVIIGYWRRPSDWTQLVTSDWPVTDYYCYWTDPIDQTSDSVIGWPSIDGLKDWPRCYCYWPNWQLLLLLVLLLLLWYWMTQPSQEPSRRDPGPGPRPRDRRRPDIDEVDPGGQWRAQWARPGQQTGVTQADPASQAMEGQAMAQADPAQRGNWPNDQTDGQAVDPIIEDS